MAQKFFDIIPPRKIQPLKEKVEKPVQEVVKIVEEVEHRRGTEVFPEKKNTYWGIIFAAVLVVVLVGGGIFAANRFSRAEIQIVPHMEQFQAKDTVSIDISFLALDIDAKKIPGKVLENQLSASQEFQATGKAQKEVKATGTITVYNAHSAVEQSLVAGTRFVSADGKLFRSVKRIVVPGTKSVSGKIIPGSVEVTVQAAGGGEEYNIAPSTFSIPGFAGTPKYTDFYGKSSAPMQGGFRGEVAQVVQGDLDKAKNTLAGKLQEQVRQALENQFGKDFVVLDQAITTDVDKAISSVPTGSDASSFQYQVQVTEKGLGFKRADIETFAKQLLQSTLAKDKKIKESSFSSKFVPITIDVDNGKMTLSVEASASAYTPLDPTELKKAISSRSLREVEAFLKNTPQIQSVQIRSFPFWQQRFPDNLNRITITLKVD